MLSLAQAVAWRKAAANNQQQVVLTNGCFDLLHRGHVSYLEASAALGDLLIVAINSDSSVRALKGPNRPLNSESDRAYVLASLRCVDAVFIFNGKRLDQEIRQIAPDIYTKAGDYTPESLDADERAALQAVGAKIKILPFLSGHSTTTLIDRAAK